MSEPANNTGSYRSVLKATSLLGGATAINVLLGMVRAKCVAILLGPGGLGLMGAYMSITSLATALTGMGVNYSGVREIAEARGSGDEARVRASVATFRRVCLWLGIAGAAVLILLSWPASMMTFGDADHTFAIACLSSTVLCAMLANYHSGIIQGSHAIGRLARLNVIAGFVGTITSLACFFVWRQEGVVPALISGAVVQWLLTRHLARKLPLASTGAPADFSGAVARRLFQFGGMMVLIGLIASVASYAQRVLILRHLDENALGMFQAADGLSGLYAGYILGAMGADFLPRLSASAHDATTSNRLVNEQTVVALLLGTPGVIATICFASVAIPIFYSTSFQPAVEVLRFMAVGVYGRLLSWPLGFLMLARGDSRAFWFNVVASLTQLAVIWLGVPFFGLKAAGIAPIVVYVIYTVICWLAARSMTGFAWSRAAKETILVGGSAVLASLCLAQFLSAWWSASLGVALLLLVAAYSYRKLCALAQIPLIERLRAKFGRQARAAA